MINIIIGLLFFGYIYQDADSLLVMGNDSLLISGIHQYNLKVQITNGGKLIVRSWTVMDTTGRLSLFAPLIHIHGGAVITASGGGYLGGNNSHPSGYGTGGGFAGGLSGGAGGGGAYGGNGGAGGDQYPGSGGTAYGFISDTIIEIGSGGGAGRLGSCDGFGGSGGGAIYFKGRTVVVDSATITTQGGSGIDGSLEAGGAGSGGGIMLRADTVRLSLSALNAGGGNGGNADFGGGGGGGGGRIKVFYSNRLDTSSVTLNCPFGSGGIGGISNGSNGIAGTVYVGPVVGIDEMNRGRTADGVISPNPGRGLFVISGFGTRTVTISVFDISGRMIKSQIMLPGRNELDLTDRVPGVYILNSEGGSGYRKLVVIR